jgi:hypothetical protein
MKTASNNSSSNVVSINPYTHSYVTTTSNVLKESSTITYDKGQYVISYLNAKHYISAKILLSINIEDEDLEDAINNKAYDELALDQAVEYEIRFVELYNHTDEENRHFYVFVVNPENIRESFNDVEKEIRYIDTIIPNALLFKSLYTKEILDDTKNNIFIYLQEDDASITFYKDGEFIYNKSIKFSYKIIHEKFCELYGEAISYKDFINFLTSSTLKKSKSKYKEHIFTIYRELFINLNEIITYVKRAFELPEIDRLYIDSSINTPTKLHELAEVELDIYASEFDFHYGFKKSNSFIESMQILLHLYTKIDEDERYDVNFTLYTRPPKLTKRPSGKVLLLIAASLIIGFAYPISYWILSSTQDIQEEALQKDYNKVHKEKLLREKSLETILKNEKRSSSVLQKEKHNYKDKQGTLIKIHDVKVNYPMKAKIIASFTRDFNLYDVKVKAMSYNEEENEKKFNLYLIANHDEDITNLVKHLTKKYKDRYKFSLKKIYLERTSQKYFTELKVTII